VTVTRVYQCCRGKHRENTKPNEGTQVNQGTNRQGRFQFLHIESEHNEDTQNKTKDQRTYTYYQGEISPVLTELINT